MGLESLKLFCNYCFAVLTYRDRMLGKKIKDIHLQRPTPHTAAKCGKPYGNMWKWPPYLPMESFKTLDCWPELLQHQPNVQIYNTCMQCATEGSSRMYSAGAKHGKTLTSCRLSVIFGPQSIKINQGTGEVTVSQTTIACSSPEIAIKSGNILQNCCAYEPAMICDQMLSQRRHLWNLIEVVKHESPFGTALCWPILIGSLLLSIKTCGIWTVPCDPLYRWMMVNA